MDREWRELATAVRRRRMQLGLSQYAAAAAAGCNRVTWGHLEKGGRHTSEYLWSGVERALGWAGGSVAAILAGGEPAEATVASTQAPPDAPLDIAADVARILGLGLPARARLDLLRALVSLHEEARAEATNTD